ncbi:MAG: alcohol dehydrogenase catalytic domain-containing protein [Acidimicrobiales bacterium]
MTPPTALPDEMPVAVYTAPGQLALEHHPTPRPGPGEVLVEVGHCGVCGTDLHLVLEGWGRPGTIPGHEASGTVAAVGDGVTAWSVGDPVVAGPTARCGTCTACRAGRPSLCAERSTPGRADPPGAFARFLLLPSDQLLAVPDGLSRRAAALTEPLAVALHAITRSAIAPGASALVSGLGPIGALVLAALRADDHPVDVVEPGPARRQLAERLGARRVLHPDELRTYSIAEPDVIDPEAVDVVFECSGHRTAMEAGLGRLARGGTLVLVGNGIDPPRFDPNRILLNELTVTGSFVYDAGGFEAALALLASGRLPLDELVEPDDVGLEGLLPAMRGLAEGRIARKVLVAP